jgi:hypothetical protein
MQHAFRTYTPIDDLSVLGRECKGAKLKGHLGLQGKRE